MPGEVRGIAPFMVQQRVAVGMLEDTPARLLNIHRQADGAARRLMQPRHLQLAPPDQHEGEVRLLGERQALERVRGPLRCREAQ